MAAYVKTGQGRQRKGAYFKCETCGEEFYVFPSYLKKSQEGGFQIRFCSRKCINKTGENNPFWGKKHSKAAKKKMSEHPNRPKFLAGEANPNFTRYGTEFGFRGSRALWWRKYLIETVGKCERCSMDDTRILNLHHVDRDRSHNERENLKLLCWNCHALEHYEAKDGFYHFLVHGKERAT